MPLYRYVCLNCQMDTGWELMPISSIDLMVCPQCNEVALAKMPSIPADINSTMFNDVH